MVFGNESGDFGGQSVFARQFHSLLDVVLDDQRAHDGFEFGVQIAVLARQLVFRKIVRLDDFSDVMKITAGSHQQIIGANRLGRRFGQFGHIQRVLIGSRRLFLQFLHQRVIQPGQLQQREVCHDGEMAFEEPEQRQRQRAAGQAIDHAASGGEGRRHPGTRRVLHIEHGEDHQRVCAADLQSAGHDVAPRLRRIQRGDSGESAHQGDNGIAEVEFGRYAEEQAAAQHKQPAQPGAIECDSQHADQSRRKAESR
ncbi:MAG: hypothetical protein BWZ10_01458 [candidate division BRC1 bacterium ADurb.BinA364]|nr:MAG: hypothetical protein BWZ10_01458 [candidate division BRC1 bacterium ADurb.BinA364]